MKQPDLKAKKTLEHLRHSTAHLLAAAVMELWPDVKRTIGPAIEDGFYYDFDFSSPISETDLPRIEEAMREIVKTWDSFERHDVSQQDAEREFQHNEFKKELINEFSGEGQHLTIYQSGNFRDLCRGGHCEHPSKEIKHFKLLSLAGAYWRGSEKNKMLTRIYGTAFPSKAELDAHLHMLEEAKKRDHRKLGRELKLFTFSDKVGKGLPLWLPNGTTIKNEIQKLALQKESEYGYQQVTTPHVAKEELYLTSGHLPYYKEGMYPPMLMDDGTYYLRAMNCPHHHMIYLDEPRSYRDLPLRLAEYGVVYRNELSGTLQGLLRVRMLSMNDAHIYCSADQLEDELEKVLSLTKEYFEIFDLSDYYFRLSLWSSLHKDKYINEPASWEHAEGVMRTLLQRLGLPFHEAQNEAAFYGPKIDVQFKSSIGREETMSTIQLDFLAKQRFGLTYIDREGKENDQVFVIHRAPLSTHERFMAFLIEHYAGNFPLWLSPVQVRIATVGEKFNDFGGAFAEELQREGIRAEIDANDETLGSKIRRASQEKIPYVVVIGEKEANGAPLSVRIRGEQAMANLKKDSFIESLKLKIVSRDNSLALQ